MPVHPTNLLYSMQRKELVMVGCTIALRFYDSIRCSSAEFDWKAILGELSLNVGASPSLVIELVSKLCAENESHCKVAVKSGIVKYIFMSYIESTLDDKYNLYKAIKLVRTISDSQRTLIHEK